jgi:hypothetical protein
MYLWQEKRAAALATIVPSVPRMVPTAQRQPMAPATPVPSVSAHPAAVVTSLESLQAPIAPKYPAPSPVAPPTSATSGLISPQDLQQEKTEAYRQVATALGQEMRSPLASILGFSQMVLAKTQDPDVVQAVESILREARSSRDVLEKLVTFVGDRSTDKTDSKIEGPIMQALKNLDLMISQKGVRVEKDFKATSPWLLASTDITKAFENLFVNAIEAMERMQDKTLKISTWESAEGLHVSVADSGEGIEIENVAKVFDPFFTTRSFAHHVGLGLPVVIGILKEHNGKIQIQSQRGKGTQVEIIFAPNAVVATGPSLPKAPPPKKGPDLPVDLPKVEISDSEGIMEMNVDSLLELPADEAPLQFLDGLGFTEPAPSMPPLPEATTPRPAKPALAPPATSPPPVTPVPPVFEVSDEDEPEDMVIAASLVIDKPTAAPMMVKKNELDSYKVEVRKPGKRN